MDEFYIVFVRKLKCGMGLDMVEKILPSEWNDRNPTNPNEMAGTQQIRMKWPEPNKSEWNGRIPTNPNLQLLWKLPIFGSCLEDLQYGSYSGIYLDADPGHRIRKDADRNVFKFCRSVILFYIRFFTPWNRAWSSDCLDFFCFKSAVIFAF